MNGAQSERRLFVNSGMLRVQPSDELGALERETLASIERDGLRDTQFVKSSPGDRQRAESLGWKAKLLDFAIHDSSPASSYEAVLDSLAGFVRCSDACAHYYRLATTKEIDFHFGPEAGTVEALVKAKSETDGKDRVTGLKTKDGVVHHAHVVVVAGRFSCSFIFVVLITASWILLNAGTARLELPSRVVGR